MIVFEANSEDPDETPHYVASHLGLRSLTTSHLWDARLKWVYQSFHSLHTIEKGQHKYTVESRYLEVEGTL